MWVFLVVKKREKERQIKNKNKCQQFPKLEYRKINTKKNKKK